MRKTLAMMLCLLIFMMAVPAQAIANDQAKTEFIANYMGFLNRNMEMQKSVMENIQNQTVKMKVAAELSDSEVTMSDGTRVSDMPANGFIELTGSLRDVKGKVNFNGQLSDNQVQGNMYLSEKGVIIPRETMESLSRAGFGDLPELQGLENIPQYIVYEMEMSPADKAMITEMFNNNTSMNEKSQEIMAFIEELLNIVPEDCFYYSNGYAVLDMKTSLLNSSALVMSLKNHRQSLAEKFAAIPAQPADMSDEEFTAFKANMESEIISMIESINISELADLEMPFSIEEFKIFCTSSSIRTAVHISADIDGNTGSLVVNSNTRSSASSLVTDFDCRIMLDSPELSLDLTMEGKDTSSMDGETVDMMLTGNINAPDGLAEGKLHLNMQADYNSSDPIVLPVLTENNSITIKDNTWNLDSDIEESYNQDQIHVYIDGWPMVFEDVPPLLADGYTMIPLRELAEMSGREVTWQPPDTIVLQDGYNPDLTFRINSADFQIGNEIRTAEKAPVIINDRTYVPLRIAAECLGYTVEWDQSTKSVLLTSE